jgi:hypothetical protein
LRIFHHFQNPLLSRPEISTESKETEFDRKPPDNRSLESAVFIVGRRERRNQSRRRIYEARLPASQDSENFPKKFRSISSESEKVSAASDSEWK